MRRKGGGNSLTWEIHTRLFSDAYCVFAAAAATICHSYICLSLAYILHEIPVSFSVTKILWPCRRYYILTTVYNRSCTFSVNQSKKSERENKKTHKRVGLRELLGESTSPLPPLLLWNGRLKRWEVTDRLSGSCSAGYAWPYGWGNERNWEIAPLRDA